MHTSNVEMEALTDEALMRAYGQGDTQAFETLYARHKGATYRYFLRHAGSNVATADELHQDLWLRVIGARERYEAQAKSRRGCIRWRGIAWSITGVRATASRWRPSRTTE